MQERIIELESKLTLAEDLLDELNRTVFRQQQEIERLQAQMRQIVLQLQSAPSAEARSAEEEIPPHY